MTNNKHWLTVMGTVPVIISTKSVDKETVVKERVLIYMVKEMQSIFLSKDTLVEISIILPTAPTTEEIRRCGWAEGHTH